MGYSLCALWRLYLLEVNQTSPRNGRWQAVLVGGKEMQTQLTFWQTFAGAIVRPVSTFKQFEEDDCAALKGVLVLLPVIGVYTLILVLFIRHNYPAAAPSILPVAVEELYQYQVWYQGPLFLVATLGLAGLLVLLARMRGEAGEFSTVFARVSFATTIPFALTTMLVELALSLLIAVGLLQPQKVLGWLTGEGTWFALTYQLVALVWIIGLPALAAKLSMGVKWLWGIAAGVLLTIVYGIPVGLFIR